MVLVLVVVVVAVSSTVTTSAVLLVSSGSTCVVSVGISLVRGSSLELSVITIVRSTIAPALSHHLLVPKASLDAAKLPVAVIVTHSTLVLSKVERLLTVVERRIVRRHVGHTGGHCSWRSIVAAVAIRSAVDGIHRVGCISRRRSRCVVTVKTTCLREVLRRCSAWLWRISADLGRLLLLWNDTNTQERASRWNMTSDKATACRVVVVHSHTILVVILMSWKHWRSTRWHWHLCVWLRW